MKVLHVCSPDAVPMQNIFTTYNIHFNRFGVHADLKFSGDDVKGYDIVHGHYALTRSVINAYRSARKNKIPFILHCHGSDVRQITPSGSKKLPLKHSLVSNRLRKKADTVILSTPDLLEWSTGFYLANPVNIDMFKPMDAKKSDSILLLGRFTAGGGILSRIDPKKKYDCLNWGHDITFPSNVKMLPFIPHHKLPELFNRYSEMIGPLVDPVSLARLEAMACGLKTYTHFPREYTAYYGFENPDDVDDPRGFVKRYHDPKKIVEVIVDIYKSTL